jgi:hypothetical protein
VLAVFRALPVVHLDRRFREVSPAFLYLGPRLAFPACPVRRVVRRLVVPALAIMPSVSRILVALAEARLILRSNAHTS